MLPIDHKVCSFYTHEVERNDASLVSDMRYISVNDVRIAKGYPVSSFYNLVAVVGSLALRNRKYDLFFRGQGLDYKDANGRSVIYPSICRPEIGQNSIYSSTIEQRFEQLRQFITFLKKQQYRQRFDEYYYALIQHYELLPTPLIDITQSLRVAATFALRDSKSGYLYVFGLPYAQGSISHFVDQNMVLVKLQSVCPANAKRPRYQEGFLAGRLPFTPVRQAGDNLANRLLAKLQLDNSSGMFWNNDFSPLPDDLLFPIKDVYRSWLQKMYIRR